MEKIPKRLAFWCYALGISSILSVAAHTFTTIKYRNQIEETRTLTVEITRSFLEDQARGISNGNIEVRDGTGQSGPINEEYNAAVRTGAEYFATYLASPEGRKMFTERLRSKYNNPNTKK